MNTMSFMVQDKKVLIDEDDLLKIAGFRWRLMRSARTSNLYVQAWVHTAVVLLHRLILDAPKGTEIDHINSNGLDNRKMNLRFCTHQQNLWNTPSKRQALKGAHWRPNLRKWSTQLGHNGKSVYLGLFDTEEEAHLVYLSFILTQRGEFARPE